MSNKMIILTPKEALDKETEYRLRREIDNLAGKGMKAAEIAKELNLDVSYVGNVIIGG